MSSNRDCTGNIPILSRFMPQAQAGEITEKFKLFSDTTRNWPLLYIIKTIPKFDCRYTTHNKWGWFIIYVYVLVNLGGYSLFVHTSLRSSYLKELYFPVSFDFQPSFVRAGEVRDPSWKIEAKGEFNSSSSSSLVYDFLSTDPLLLSCDWLPDSPVRSATEAAKGGK